MTYRSIHFGGALVIAAAVSFASAQAAQYGDTPAAPAAPRGAAQQNNGPTPRTPDGHPDLSGMWNGGGGGGGQPGQA